MHVHGADLSPMQRVDFSLSLSRDIEFTIRRQVTDNRLISGQTRNLVEEQTPSAVRYDNALYATIPTTGYIRQTFKSSSRTKRQPRIRDYSNHTGRESPIINSRGLVHGSPDWHDFIYTKVLRGRMRFLRGLPATGYWWQRFKRRTCGERDRFDFQLDPPQLVNNSPPLPEAFSVL